MRHFFTPQVPRTAVMSVCHIRLVVQYCIYNISYTSLKFSFSYYHTCTTIKLCYWRLRWVLLVVPVVSPRPASSPHLQPMSDAGVWFQPVFTVRCYASAVFAVMQCPSVRPSVCLSRSWITSKRINISSKFFHHRVATPF